MKKILLPLLLITALFARSQSGKYLPVKVSVGQNVYDNSIVYDSSYYIRDGNNVFVWGAARAIAVAGGNLGTSIKFTPPFPMITPPPYNTELVIGQATIDQAPMQPFAAGRVRVNTSGQFLVYWNQLTATSVWVNYSFAYTIK